MYFTFLGYFKTYTILLKIVGIYYYYYIVFTPTQVHLFRFILYTYKHLFLVYNIIVVRIIKNKCVPRM